MGALQKPVVLHHALGQHLGNDLPWWHSQKTLGTGGSSIEHEGMVVREIVHSPGLANPEKRATLVPIIGKAQHAMTSQLVGQSANEQHMMQHARHRRKMVRIGYDAA